MPYIGPSTKSNLSISFDKPVPILPPSPPDSLKVSPKVLEILDFLRSRKKGQISPAWDEAWNKIKLSLEDYEGFESILENDRDLWGYVQDKVRYDWDSRNLTLTFRMPSGIHEMFLARLDHSIIRQLDTIASGSHGMAAMVAQQIKSGKSTDLYMSLQDGQKDKRCPDGQWRHERGLPPLIIEISYSQKTKDLSHLADDYIVGSFGDIGTVVGIDIEYRRTKEARIMKWQREFVIEDGETILKSKLISNEKFRQEDGHASPGNFILCLEDFASQGSLQNMSEEIKATPVMFSHATLTEYLNEAEKMHQEDMEDLKNDTSLARSLSFGIKRHFRPETPPEEVGSADEATFVEAEIAAERRRSDEDDDFIGDSESSGVIRRSLRNAQS